MVRSRQDESRNGCAWKRSTAERLMTNHREPRHLIAIVATLLPLVPSPAVTAPLHTPSDTQPTPPTQVLIAIEDLGAVDAHTPTFAVALNNRRDVVGLAGLT